MHWIVGLAHSMGFPWGFLALCLFCAIVVALGARVVRWAILLASFGIISSQRRLGGAPFQVQYGLEEVVDAAPRVIRTVLGLLGMALALWLVLFLARKFLPFAGLRAFETFMTTSARQAFEWLSVFLVDKP
ncbi:hypothetical protein [Phenylobacterium sp.]|uniref:hypothetical protein n=1 Tax=Phenylobacterium sp. TaxID=1871053 RepID=UPI0025E94006|nr:hypothetical protein [Phenylobacterium sp.]MBX3484701.1 hypothetical protein [Phenylobacterium sp.]MCW5759718.1 hypothetical protein [Phenylobacterium sp.]